MAAADAARLREDPALNAMLDSIEKQATGVAINHFDPATRNAARNMAMAINQLRVEIQDRCDTILVAEHARQRAMASE
jgi:hypothetical protein